MRLPGPVPGADDPEDRMSNDDQNSGWAAPDEPGTFIPPSWDAPQRGPAPDSDDSPSPPWLDLTLHPAGPVGGGGSKTFNVPNAGGPVGSVIAGMTGPSPRKKRGCLRKILIAFAVIIVLFTALGIWVFKSTAGAEKEAHAFVNEVVAGDVDAAYARTAGAYREKNSKLDFATGVESDHADFGGAKVSNIGRYVSSKTGCPSRAVMTYRLESDSSTNYARIVLQKINGAWKVVNPTFTASAPNTGLTDEGC